MVISAQCEGLILISPCLLALVITQKKSLKKRVISFFVSDLWLGLEDKDDRENQTKLKSFWFELTTRLLLLLIN